MSDNASIHGLDPKLSQTRSLGQKGRRGYVPPEQIAQDEHGYEDIDSYFNVKKKRTKELKPGELEDTHTELFIDTEIEAVSGLDITVPDVTQLPETPAKDRVRTAQDDLQRMVQNQRQLLPPTATNNMPSPMRSPFLRPRSPRRPDSGAPVEAPEFEPIEPIADYDEEADLSADAPIVEGNDISDDEMPPLPTGQDDGSENGVSDVSEAAPESKRRYERNETPSPEVYEIDASYFDEPDYVESEPEKLAFIADDADEEVPDVDSFVVPVPGASLSASEEEEDDFNSDGLDDDDDDDAEDQDTESSSGEDEGPDTMADETTMLVPDVSMREPGALRRSTRHRIPPLKFWVGEHAVYKTDAAHLPVLDKVIHVEVKEKPKRKYHRRLPSIYDQYRDNVDELLAKAEVQANVFDETQKDFRERTVAKSINGMDFQYSPGNPLVRTANLLTGSSNLPFQSTVMIMEKKGAIPRRNSGEYAYAFIILSGSLSVTVHDKTFKSFRGMLFEVPRSNEFSFKNVGATQARLLIVQTKIKERTTEGDITQGMTSLAQFLGSEAEMSAARQDASELASNASASDTNTEPIQVLAGLDD